MSQGVHFCFYSVKGAREASELGLGKLTHVLMAVLWE